MFWNELLGLFFKDWLFIFRKPVTQMWYCGQTPRPKAAAGVFPETCLQVIWLLNSGLWGISDTQHAKQANRKLKVSVFLAGLLQSAAETHYTESNHKVKIIWRKPQLVFVKSCMSHVRRNFFCVMTICRMFLCSCNDMFEYSDPAVVLCISPLVRKVPTRDAAVTNFRDIETDAWT